MLLFVSWRNKYAIIEWLLFDAPTSIHGVFTSFSISQYCCCISEKIKSGPCWLKDFYKGQAKFTKCYFLWVGGINMQSLSGHYLMGRMVFLLLLVYLGTVVYISVEIGLGSFWCRDILRVKGQALFPNCNFLWLCVICNRVATIWCAIKYPRCLYFFGLSKCCCLHFCRNKFGLLLVQGIFKGSEIKDLSQIATFYDFVWYAIIKWYYYSMRHQVPMVFLRLLIYLSAVTCISEERNLGQYWCKDILRVKGQA